MFGGLSRSNFFPNDGIHKTKQKGKKGLFRTKIRIFQAEGTTYIKTQ